MDVSIPAPQQLPAFSSNHEQQSVSSPLCKHPCLEHVVGLQMCQHQRLMQIKAREMNASIWEDKLKICPKGMSDRCLYQRLINLINE